MRAVEVPETLAAYPFGTMINTHEDFERKTGEMDANKSKYFGDNILRSKKVPSKQKQ